MLLALRKPTSGRIRVLGSDPYAGVKSGRVGAMLQSGGADARSDRAGAPRAGDGFHPRPLPVGQTLRRAGIADIADRRALAGGRVIDPDLAAAALAEGVNPLTRRERPGARGVRRRIAQLGDRCQAVPVRGNGAELPVVLYPEDRCPQPRRSAADCRGTRLARLSAMLTPLVRADRAE